MIFAIKSTGLCNNLRFAMRFLFREHACVCAVYSVEPKIDSVLK